MQMQPQQRGGGGNMINMDRSSRSIFGEFFLSADFHNIPD
jgi:hypothetical protein